jgi:Uncharacterized conserved protein
MHRIIIHKLGPIEDIELRCDHFMLLTGSQASGKSTTAKVVYFFRTVKDEIMELAIRLATDADYPERDILLRSQMESRLREKFMQLFGSSWGMDNGMRISCQYGRQGQTSLEIYLTSDQQFGMPNFIYIGYSGDIRKFLNDQEEKLRPNSGSLADQEKAGIKKALAELFDDDFDTVYIPAGRSMITLLASQLDYIYATMSDAQKRGIDFCTRRYWEEILRLRPEFYDGLSGLRRDNDVATELADTVMLARKVIDEILKGEYRSKDREERLVIDNGRYVKINFTSSGQQEVVWILNLLFYYLIKRRKTFFIIEEPESHLFPDAQKNISNLVSLVANEGHEALLTTHSPYVLGSLNNLLYAGQMKEGLQEATGRVIDKRFWISPNTFGAWFIRDGMADDCMDAEIGLIRNELIDGISEVINNEYEELFSIRHGIEGAE